MDEKYKEERARIRRRAGTYVFWKEILFRMFGKTLFIVIDKKDREGTVKSLQDGLVHWDITAKVALATAKFWCLSVHEDVSNYVYVCHVCQ